MRKKLLESKLARVIDNLNLVSDNIPSNFEEFKNLGLVKDGICQRVEFAIEEILDICSVINADLGLGTPETEDNILDNLEIKKILSKKTIDIIKDMKRFRNLLVHRYGEINDEIAFETISEGLNDFDLIIKEIENVLKKYNGKKEKK